MQTFTTPSKVPFTLYDIFGYLLPGITFCLLVFCFQDMGDLETIFRNKINNSFLFSHAQSSPWFAAGIILVAGYTGGHVIAALSSFLIEKLIVSKFLGLPAKNLLFGNIDPGRKETKTGTAPKGILILLRGRIVTILKAKLPTFVRIANLMSFQDYRTPYKPSFCNKLSSRFHTVFSIEITEENTEDAFWLCFEFVALKCPVAYARAINFVNLYGFSRNLAMAFMIGWISYLVTLLFYTESMVNYGLEKLLIATLCFIISLALTRNYLRLFKSLNNEVFRAFYAQVTMAEYLNRRQEETNPAKEPLLPD